jgi:ligand-binding SRPBCC domain-containing protein
LTTVPAIRIRNCNQPPARPCADVLDWMIATRRLHCNEHCAAFAKPLLIFEALRVGYPRASDRLHCFVLDGMAENALTCQSRGVRYYPYVEPSPGAGKGLLTAFAQNACVMVTDDYPCFFLPRMVAAAAKKLSVRLEAVDSDGLLPIRATDQAFLRAFDCRRFFQKELPAISPISRTRRSARQGQAPSRACSSSENYLPLAGRHQSSPRRSSALSRTGNIDSRGSRVTLRVSVGPFSQDWIARHSACGPGRFFRDVMVSGPFPGWEHTHKFLPDAATSSWLEDIVEYDLPLGWLGKLLAAAYTRRLLQRLFAWHHKITGEQHAERSRKGAF